MPDFIPYGRQQIDEDDIAAVTAALRSDWLTTGPAVTRFEDALASRCGVKYATAVNSGTAALQCAYYAAGVTSRDEVIVPSLTFSATANAARHLGATVRFADVDPATLTISVESARARVNERTKAIVAVDYAGHPADYDALRELCRESGATLIADACHSLGGSYKGKPVGSLADITCLSFHPVKTITSGEGGAVLTNRDRFDGRARLLRNHGMHRDVETIAGDPVGAWAYDIGDLGHNFRITDIQCALGASQLSKLDEFVKRRREIAALYRELLADLTEVQLPPEADWCEHGYHLFPIRVAAGKRHALFDELRERALGVQVHYIPVNALSGYRRLGYSPEDTPRALEAYRGLISLPLFPAMTDDDVRSVVSRLRASL